MKIELDQPERPKANRIFVYCDLKHTGKQNNILISNGSQLLGRAKVENFALYNILNSYPMAVPMKNAVKLIGEVWTLTHPKLIENLDNIKSPMERAIIDVNVGKSTEKCWIYYMPDSKFNSDAIGVRKIKEGKWKV